LAAFIFKGATMNKEPEKPEYLQPVKVVQGPDGYSEVYKNVIGFGTGQWEPTLKKN
jgi:hypothetical protein